MERAALLLLVPTTSYRTDAFRDAARRLGVPVVVGSNRCPGLQKKYQDQDTLTLDFRHPEKAARQIASKAPARGIRAIVPVNEQTAVIAALAAAALGFPHNSPESTARAGNKARMREALAAAKVPSPAFQVFSARADPAEVARKIRFPCVLKPLLLSASRGVIRANDVPSFGGAWHRVARLLAKPELRALDPEESEKILVEDFVPGEEVAVEGLLVAGKLTLLALFDKPDPLDGPFFEETIYVTPSRHPQALQARTAKVTEAAARALGLADGPVHAELRLSPEGPVVIEIAARSIGGLCSRTLKFGAGLSLEEIIISHAMGLPVPTFDRERSAAGVMMIPIPRAGILRGITGLAAARAVAGVEDVVMTVEKGRDVLPLPEGDCYLGFIFARGSRPEDVEEALRESHRRLKLDIRAPLPTVRA